jgi:hypothetical protein
MIPAPKIEGVMDGLAKTHQAGIRYPITSFFDFQATFPPKYRELANIWQEEGEL